MRVRGTRLEAVGEVVVHRVLAQEEAPLATEALGSGEPEDLCAALVVADADAEGLFALDGLVRGWVRGEGATLDGEVLRRLE